MILVNLILAGVICLGMIKSESQSVSAAIKDNLKSDTLSLGSAVYKKSCALCHRMNGEGMSKVIPPLAKSDYLKREKEEIIELIIAGKSGPITVNNVEYNRPMPPSNLSDREISEVLNYIFEIWVNPGTSFKEEEVKRVRLQLSSGKKE